MRQSAYFLRRQSRCSRKTAWPNKSDLTKCSSTAKVGGEGGWDYIYADVAGRRLYIPRRGTPAAADVQTRLSIYDLDTLELAGEIAGIGGNGTAVDPKSGHGFTSSKPVSMFDTKTMTLIKTIDGAEAHGRTASISMRSTKGSTSSVIRPRTRR